MQAASNNVKTYAASAVFYSAGSTGVQILQQIFIADTSSLRNRALCSTIPNIPYLINVWIGAPIAHGFLTRSSWRWGYGVWAIVLPTAFMPLAMALFINQRKAAKQGRLPPSPYVGQGLGTICRSLWYELDVFGLLLLSAGISLILIPLTLAASAKGGWVNPSILAMILVGFATLAVFPFWERNEKMAPRAFLPTHLLKDRTVLVGVTIAFFYFSECHITHKSHVHTLLTPSSGILSLRLPILLLLPAYCSRPVSHLGWSYHSDLHFHLDRNRPDRISDH